jgi:hypothetical protein
MRGIAVLLGILLAAAPAAAQNPFTPRLDELPPPRGQPICDDWYARVALPKYGCHADTIRKICTGQLPKVNSGPYCGDR